MDPDKKSLDDLQSHDSESFLRRWSDRKLASQQPLTEVAEAENRAAQEQLCDEDMPPLELLTDTSDYSGFLSPRVSETLRKMALRKLFHGSDFNLCDGLDDYAEDFTAFEALGDVITADLRHQMEVEEQRKAQQQVLADMESVESDCADEPGDEVAIDQQQSAEQQLPGATGDDDNRETPS
jgi:hypothetical protein